MQYNNQFYKTPVKLVLRFPGILNENFNIKTSCENPKDIYHNKRCEILNGIESLIYGMIELNHKYNDPINWKDICPYKDEKSIEDLFKTKAVIDSYIIEHPQYCLQTRIYFD